MLTSLRPLVLTLLFVTVSWIAVPHPAAAHDELVDSSPAAGAELLTPPSEITLTFSGPPMELGATLLVVDADGVNHATEPPTFRSRTASVPVDDMAPDANYQIRWRVVSADGHVLSGVVDFAVGDTSQAKPMPEPASARTMSDADSSSGRAEGGHAGRTTGVALTGALAALLLTGGGWWVRNRSRTRRRDMTSTSSTEEN